MPSAEEPASSAVLTLAVFALLSSAVNPDFCTIHRPEESSYKRTCLIHGSNPDGSSVKQRKAAGHLLGSPAASAVGEFHRDLAALNSRLTSLLLYVLLPTLTPTITC